VTLGVLLSSKAAVADQVIAKDEDTSQKLTGESPLVQNNASIIGVSIGGAVVFFCLIAVGFFVYRKCHKTGGAGTQNEVVTPNPQTNPQPSSPPNLPPSSVVYPISTTDIPEEEEDIDETLDPYSDLDPSSFDASVYMSPENWKKNLHVGQMKLIVQYLYEHLNKSAKKQEFPDPQKKYTVFIGLKFYDIPASNHPLHLYQNVLPFYRGWKNKPIIIAVNADDNPKALAELMDSPITFKAWSLDDYFKRFIDKLKTEEQKVALYDLYYAAHEILV